jgi:hypothetical protein
MSKPLGYYGCDHANQLISDISETFGDNLQNLPAHDRVWLIARIALYYAKTYSPDSGVRDESLEIVGRLSELPQNQLAALIQALAN